MDNNEEWIIENDKKENLQINNNNEIYNEKIDKDINKIKMNNIDTKFNYFKNTKDNYDKLFIHEYIENVQLIENNQEIIDKKLNYLKLNKDLYNNIKKPEIDIKLKLKKQTKNLFIEELSNSSNDKENNDSYFKISSEAFNINNNKNKLYKADELLFSINN